MVFREVPHNIITWFINPVSEIEDDFLYLFIQIITKILSISGYQNEHRDKYKIGTILLSSDFINAILDKFKSQRCHLFLLIKNDHSPNDMFFSIINYEFLCNFLTLLYAVSCFQLQLLFG